MSYRKVINRMKKAQKAHSDSMSKIASSCNIGVVGSSDFDHGINNVGVEAYNIHVKIWNQLQRYINSLGKKK